MGFLPEHESVIDADASAEVLIFRTSHEIRWDRLSANDAADVRDALVTADAVRRSHGYLRVIEGGLDPGRQYLEDFALQKAS